MNAGEEPGKRTQQTAGAWARASGEGFAEITSGRSRWQQGLVATCTDSSTEVTSRRRGEPRGIGECARRSEDRGVMTSQEAVHVSLTEVTPTSGKGALGTWWFLRQVRARLDKTEHSTATRARDDGMSKPSPSRRMRTGA